MGVSIMSNPGEQKKQPAVPETAWTFFSNHGHVLLCLASDPDIVLREVALRVGITERAVQRIVRDLEDAGAIRVAREGRRNKYRVNRRLRLRHTIERHRTIGDLLNFVHGNEH